MGDVEPDTYIIFRDVFFIYGRKKLIGIGHQPAQSDPQAHGPCRCVGKTDNRGTLQEQKVSARNGTGEKQKPAYVGRNQEAPDPHEHLA